MNTKHDKKIGFFKIDLRKELIFDNLHDEYIIKNIDNYHFPFNYDISENGIKRLINYYLKNNNQYIKNIILKYNYFFNNIDTFFINHDNWHILIYPYELYNYFKLDMNLKFFIDNIKFNEIFKYLNKFIKILDKYFIEINYYHKKLMLSISYGKSNNYYYSINNYLINCQTKY